MMKNINKKGFTLIELLIAVAIVGIIAVVAFVALDPARRLRDSRTAKRYTDVSALLEAIKVAQVDDGGAYKGGLQTIASDGVVRMITTTTEALGCAPVARVVDAACDVAIAIDSCVNLTPYVGGYISALPESPTSADTGRLNWSLTTGPDGNGNLVNETGYYLQKNANGTITVGSCDGEPESATPGVNEIRITR